MVENRLQYDKLEIVIHCWDLYNNETTSKITFEYNGNFFISTTTILNEHWWNKILRKFQLTTTPVPLTSHTQRHSFSQITLSYLLSYSKSLFHNQTILCL